MQGKVEEMTSGGNIGLKARALSLWPGFILAAIYVFSAVIIASKAYNLLIAGALIGTSMFIRAISEVALKRIVRYMFLTGIVIGIVGIVPPIYFAVLYGIVSPIELTLSIACMALTVIILIKIRSLNVL
ncbi:MAG: hypothetical protein ACUVQY_08170 [Thermoproteota archaeon]